MSETQINELKRDLKDKGEIIKSLIESNNDIIVNQQITKPSRKAPSFSYGDIRL